MTLERMHIYLACVCVLDSPLWLLTEQDMAEKDVSSSSSSSTTVVVPASSPGSNQVSYPRILKVESEVMLEHELIVVDVLLTLARPNPQSVNQDVPATHSSSSNTTAADSFGSTYQIALEVDGPHHYMRNRLSHTDGSSEYRNRVLQRRLGAATGGSGVAIVRTSVWVEQLRDHDARRRYLAELLAASVPPM